MVETCWLYIDFTNVLLILEQKFPSTHGVAHAQNSLTIVSGHHTHLEQTVICSSKYLDGRSGLVFCGYLVDANFAHNRVGDLPSIPLRDLFIFISHHKYRTLLNVKIENPPLLQ